MKKTSKILGSIALSAALAMGTAVPAFAATTSSEADPTLTAEGTTMPLTVDDNKNADTSSTIISASTYTSQLSVTIPLAVPLKFDTVGGAGLAPSANAYYIKNNSSSNITVTKATYAVTDNKWELADAAITGTPGDPVGNVEVGDFYLKVAPTATPEDGTLADLELKAVSGKRDGGTATLNWGIKPAQTYGFALSPSSSKLKKTIDGTSNIASITYTVAVGKTADAVMGTTTDNSEDPEATVTTAGAAMAKPAMTGAAIKASFGDNVTFVTESNASTTVADDAKVQVKAVKVSMMGTWMDCPANGNLDKSQSYQITVVPVTE